VAAAAAAAAACIAVRCRKCHRRRLSCRSRSPVCAALPAPEAAPS
jgi:hypothetical protein